MKKEFKMEAKFKGRIIATLDEFHQSGDVTNAAYTTLAFAINQVFDEINEEWFQVQQNINRH